MYRPEKEYFDYLKDKNVILVGPANYLRGQRRGDYIDSFDCVVRVNLGYPVKYPEDYGSRTNVLYRVFHFIWNEIKAGRIDKKEMLQDLERLDWLISKYEPREVKFTRLKNFLSDKVVWTAMPDGFHRDFRRSFGLPNTGISALLHLFNSELKSLEVVGFDFYATGYHDGYKRGTGKYTKNPHDTKSQLKILSKIKDDRLKLNKELQELVNESINRDTCKDGQ